MTEKHVLKWQVSRAKTKSDNEALAATSVTLGMETSSNIKKIRAAMFLFLKSIYSVVFDFKNIVFTDCFLISVQEVSRFV